MLRKAVPVRYLLLGAFLLAGVLPTLFITGLAFYEARNTLKTEIEHDMQTRAIATANEVDRMMFERLQNTASWSKLEIMQDIRIGDVDKRLSRFLSELKSSYQNVYSELDAVDDTGTIVASSNHRKIGSRLPALQNSISIQLGRTAVKISPLQGDQLPISVAIEDTISGATLGTLVAVFDWQQIHLVLENAVAGRGAAGLFDRDDHLLAHTEYWQQIQAAPTLSAFAITNGYQGFTGFSWQVEISQERSQVLAPIRKMAYIFLAILAIAVLLAGIIVIPLARSITQPLARLTRFANNFMHAPSSMLPPSGGPTEVAMMATAFGKMIDDLENSRADLLRAAKLAVAGEMAAAMSHEVRTPLGILRSSAQLLLREPDLSEEAREVCGFIVSETDRLNKLVSTLIDSARPRTPEFSATDIAELARQTAAMLRAQTLKKDIRLSFESDGQAIAWCDTEQITQVLLNLLLNAIQVLPDGGSIMVRVRQTSGLVVTTIADDGPGIPQELQDKVFDPFFTQREGGIGLGLAVVRQIVLAHHGKISVGRSKMGGAEFRLELPAAETISE